MLINDENLSDALLSQYTIGFSFLKVVLYLRQSSSFPGIQCNEV